MNITPYAIIYRGVSQKQFSPKETYAHTTPKYYNYFPHPD
jgi:hypothetical protein